MPSKHSRISLTVEKVMKMMILHSSLLIVTVTSLSVYVYMTRTTSRGSQLAFFLHYHVKLYTNYSLHFLFTFSILYKVFFCPILPFYNGLFFYPPGKYMIDSDLVLYLTK